MNARGPDEPGRPGRPRGSSREMLQEAASELFLEQTYARTTIEQIARHAGVSRNTFFNYFQAKSDLLWVEVDVSLERLPAALRAAGPSEPTDAVRRALLDVASDFGPARVPWALTQQELMATTGELEASALSRLSAQAHLLAGFVARRADGADGLLCRGFAVAVLSAAAAAAVEWAGAGVARGNLAPYVDAAIAPVCEGFRGRFSQP
ncbi:TetR/AcrR family transcriptional regulator [Cryobacterium tepidiphilum]|uniref:TetR family transcriptional regulator n=1 Tax=Cryobacterium tepidiphilum TaxID=2486026 RepID=A0A3M8KVP3_9MICO|nr:TetR/AcrR family transcriptional regulator [Cryobacterium tepidiphilum]RNE57206.1 TetR family transcriptional regulator [Cryobacterium tepidiphilum]